MNSGSLASMQHSSRAEEAEKEHGDGSGFGNDTPTQRYIIDTEPLVCSSVIDVSPP